MDDRSKKPKFTVIKPHTKGQIPTARYMHSFDYMPKLGAVTLYGGRNDFLQDMSILDDLWLL